LDRPAEEWAGERAGERVAPQARSARSSTEPHPLLSLPYRQSHTPPVSPLQTDPPPTPPYSSP
ncbi:hypothetical protein NHX12_027278, partial [Muraenolepis orangiensis]